ncbi:hypothetical protein XaplCFBP3123_08570 [Xanthomonas arboricola pv. populi]|nr:hypothetical protein XaplCFBP3123_08570 [Xanthomonas arboricola pv. populi]
MRGGESGIGNRESGIGNREWGMGNGEWGMGNRKSQIRGPELLRRRPARFYHSRFPNLHSRPQLQ